MAEDCPKCGEDTDADAPCAECRREIHESWHKQGLWWIRLEECHPECPGNKEHPITEDKLVMFGG